MEKKFFVFFALFVFLTSFVSADQRVIFNKFGQKAFFLGHVYEFKDVSYDHVVLEAWPFFERESAQTFLVSVGETVQKFNAFITLNKVFISRDYYYVDLLFSSSIELSSQTHLVCVNQKCVRVKGGGADKCSRNSQCLVTHLKCVNKQCVSVFGVGSDSCSSDFDCNSTHLACVNQSCVEVSGRGSHECYSNKDCIPGELPRKDSIVYAGGLHFSLDEHFGFLMNLLDRMKSSSPSYNAVLLSSAQLIKPGIVREEDRNRFNQNLRAFVSKARDLGISVYANAFFPWDILSDNPNLAEGSLVKDARFKVERNSNGDLVGRFQNEVLIGGEDGGFELVDENGFRNWNLNSLRENFNTYVFADSGVKKSGSYSMKLSYDGSQGSKSIRLIRTVYVKPFTQYRVRVFVKTQGFKNPKSIEFSIRDPYKAHLPLAKIINPIYNPKIYETQDWTEYYSSFNSGINSFVYLFIGSWDAREGTVWFDDLEIESTVVNVLNTRECPIVVKDSSSGTTYIEGGDFIFRDTNLSKFKLNYSNPVIEIPSGSRIQEGQELSVDFCAAITYKPFPSLTNPETFNVFRNHLINLNSLIPELSGVVVGADEIRVLNNINPVPGRTPGMILAQASNRVAEIAKQINPNWELIYWSDMYDPQMNQKDGYYLTNGPLEGSEQGLPKKAVILDWNVKTGEENKESRLASRNWFSNLGMRFVIAGYYDSLTGLNEITEYVREAKDIPGYYGYMYTTWTKNYDNLETFAIKASSLG